MQFLKNGHITRECHGNRRKCIYWLLHTHVHKRSRKFGINTYCTLNYYIKLDDGNTYSGDWSAFGTADAYVYFDPTVRTYDVEDITPSSAMLRGYVVAGSDDVREQGFEYRAAARETRALGDAGWNVAAADGISMSVCLTTCNLPPHTSTAPSPRPPKARCTAWKRRLPRRPSPEWKASGRQTKRKHPVEYYDLQGRRHAGPFKGLNLIRYSDGSVHKVLVK